MTPICTASTSSSAGRPTTNNDITVAGCSSFLLDILSCYWRLKLPEGYIVYGKSRDWYLYYFTDGIYPEWAILVKPKHELIKLGERVMTKMKKGGTKVLSGCLESCMVASAYYVTIFTNGAM